jgi:hypothetical protein
LGNSGNFGKNQENSAETQLTYKRNRKTLRNRNSVEFTELSAAFTNNLLTFTENRPGDFRANNVKPAELSRKSGIGMEKPWKTMA